MPEDGPVPRAEIVDFATLPPPKRRRRQRIPAIQTFDFRPFDLNDFMDQLQMIRETGPFEQLVGMIPGLSLETRNVYVGVDQRQWRRVEAVVASMTPWERSHPDRLDDSRRRRIVRGSGTSMRLIGKVLGQFNEMRRMMNGPRGSGPSVA